MRAKHLPSVLYTLFSLQTGFYSQLRPMSSTCDLGKSQSHLPAFSSTKQDNKPCPSLPQDCWRVPTSSRTGDCAPKYPVWGIMIFEGLQFLSTRVALRHYTILKRLLNQQRISTSMVAVRVAALMRQGSILNWGMVLCSCHTGPRDAGIPVSSQSLAIVAWHCAVGAHTAWSPKCSKPQGPICKSTGPPPLSSSGEVGEKQ